MGLKMTMGNRRETLLHALAPDGLGHTEGKLHIKQISMSEQKVV